MSGRLPCGSDVAMVATSGMTVAVRDLKNRLSEYLRRVRAGERIVVTDRGHPIAELAPLETGQLSPAQRLRRLSASGDVTLPRGGSLRPVRALVVRGRPVSRTLLDDRG